MALCSPNIMIEDFQLYFGANEIFNHLSLTLKAGLWTCLLGQSGVGKSTLLRAVAGLEDSTDISGRITFDSNNSSVAYMGQQAFLLPWLSVIDNVMLGPTLRGETKDEAAALDMLKKVGLEQAANLKPAQLSGGMQQRCALARTLFEDRPAVMMDEPFSALDAVTRHQLQALTHDLLREKTVLLVTHDPLEALRLGDVIYVLEGRPAKLMPAITPESPAPRAVGNPEVDQLYPDLMAKLSAAERIKL